MNHIKVVFTITPNITEASEILIAHLGDIGYESFVITDTGFEAYIPEKDFNESLFVYFIYVWPQSVIAEFSRRFHLINNIVIATNELTVHGNQAQMFESKLLDRNLQ